MHLNFLAGLKTPTWIVYTQPTSMWLWGITNVWIGSSCPATPCENQQQTANTTAVTNPIFESHTREDGLDNLADFLIIVVLRHVTVTTEAQTGQTPDLSCRLFFKGTSDLFTGSSQCKQCAHLEVRAIFFYPAEKMSKNTKIMLVFGGFVTAVAAAFYPIFFYPLTHKDEYSKLSFFAFI